MFNKKIDQALVYNLICWCLCSNHIQNKINWIILNFYMQCICSPKSGFWVNNESVGQIVVGPVWVWLKNGSWKVRCGNWMGVGLFCDLPLFILIVLFTCLWSCIFKTHLFILKKENLRFPKQNFHSFFKYIYFLNCYQLGPYKTCFGSSFPIPLIKLHAITHFLNFQKIILKKLVSVR